MARRPLHTPALFDPSSLRGWGMIVAATLVIGIGCRKEKAPKALVRYEEMPAKKVPAYMKGTIFERTDLQNTEYFPVSGYGLVNHLDNTGDSTAPTKVREYMINLMAKRGFGSPLMPGYKLLTPERALADKSYAIVEVYGYLPPGARKDQWFDVQVNALQNNDTTSLAHGVLFRTDLRINGVNPVEPGGSVNVYARGEGQIFVNPAYALEEGATSTAARASLRSGIVMDGGRVMNDRPLILRLLQPQRAMARQIEWRIDQRFQDPAAAAAKDEGIVYFFVPPSYNGDWEHFSNVVTHLYFESGAEFSAHKAKELADAAQQDGAPLMDISYCWEGLGSAALPFVRPLMESAKPDIAFAAARAAAFVGDSSAESALMQMAQSDAHPFQVNAVQTLGALPQSPVINQMLRRLVDSGQNVVRVEAYKILAQHKDTSIFSKPIGNKFVLDIVPSSGPPIIYATRTGLPRIAIIGDRATVTQPVTFTAMDSRFSISTAEAGRGVTLFYRGAELPKPIKVVSRPDVAEIVARLGGEGPLEEIGFDFGYGDIVAILQALGDSRRLSATRDGKQLAASFVLQELPQTQDDIYNAPIIGEKSRPQGDTPPPLGATE